MLILKIACIKDVLPRQISVHVVYDKFNGITKPDIQYPLVLQQETVAERICLICKLHLVSKSHFYTETMSLL